MNATRWIGVAVSAMALLGAAGCGGGSMAPMAPAAESPPAYGYGGASKGMADAAPPPPAQPGMAPEGSAAPRAMEQSGPRGDAAEPMPMKPADRPGLGTEWGETRLSRISTVPFQRADAMSPFTTASLFYNDEEGARAMASNSGFRRTSGGMYTIGGGVASIGLRDEHGAFFSGFVAGSRNYVVGEAGRRYTIMIRNNTGARLEVVLSVDGLDVLDGKPASFSKRGYLVDPHGSVEIDGFRQSVDAVAAFRFGSVRGSYAGQKHGDTRNVGVIGVALFNERGSNPWTADEVQRRKDANPFPGQFATPPGAP